MANDRHQRVRAGLRSERGVSLIHVAISILVLMGFAAFVLDHGVMMLARGQAQNVADAAALSGAITRLKDEVNPSATPPVNGISDKAITHAVNQGTIFGGTSANIGYSRFWEGQVECPLTIPALPADAWCLQVNVFRDGTNGSTALPVYFAPLFGMTSQKTRATATAVAKSANGTTCLKPFLIPDKWLESGTGDPNRFNPDDGDIYRPWTDPMPTGYSTADFNITAVVLKPGHPGGTISPGDFYEINEFGATGGAAYEAAIVNCEISKTIGDTVELFPGGTVGPTNQGIDALLAANGGVADVVIGMFDPAVFEAQRRQSGRIILQIVNMLSVRISNRRGNQIDGVIVGGVGEDMGPSPTPTGASSLIKVVQLVR